MCGCLREWPRKWLILCAVAPGVPLRELCRHAWCPFRVFGKGFPVVRQRLFWQSGQAVSACCMVRPRERHVAPGCANGVCYRENSATSRCFRTKCGDIVCVVPVSCVVFPVLRFLFRDLVLSGFFTVEDVYLCSQAHFHGVVAMWHESFPRHWFPARFRRALVSCAIFCRENNNKQVCGHVLIYIKKRAS